MKDRDRFNSICRAIWGDEWQRKAAHHLGVSRRSVIYWSSGTFPPKDGWASIFASLLSGCAEAMKEMIQRRAVINDFKRTYSGGRGR